MEVLTAKEQVIQAGRVLLEKGLVARTWGNVSCRIDRETFAITSSGRSYELLTPQDIVQVKIADLSHNPNEKPSSEVRIHAELYKTCDAVNFIIHTHQENASVLSAIGFDVIRLDKAYEGLGDEVLCADYALPGTKKLCKNVLKSVKESKGNAVIMKNHGVLCFGGDFEETLAIATTLEVACVQYIDKKRERFGDGKAYEDFPEEIVDMEFLEQLKEAAGDKKKIIWNEDPEVIRVSKLVSSLDPFVDDFAQIVGHKMITSWGDISKIKKHLCQNGAFFIFGRGAICMGDTQSDAEAISMIVRKNCKAFLGITLFCKPKPINPIECMLMRLHYLKNYSKKI